MVFPNCSTQLLLFLASILKSPVVSEIWAVKYQKSLVIKIWFITKRWKRGCLFLIITNSHPMSVIIKYICNNCCNLSDFPDPVNEHLLLLPQLISAFGGNSVHGESSHMNSAKAKLGALSCVSGFMIHTWKRWIFMTCRGHLGNGLVLSCMCWQWWPLTCLLELCQTSWGQETLSWKASDVPTSLSMIGALNAVCEDKRCHTIVFLAL